MVVLEAVVSDGGRTEVTRLPGVVTAMVLTEVGDVGVARPEA